MSYPVSKLQGNGGAQHDICKPEERFGDSLSTNPEETIKFFIYIVFRS